MPAGFYQPDPHPDPAQKPADPSLEDLIARSKELRQHGDELSEALRALVEQLDEEAKRACNRPDDVSDSSRPN